jgi:hypothetical protein
LPRPAFTHHRSGLSLVSYWWIHRLVEGVCWMSTSTQYSFLSRTLLDSL